MVFYYYYEQLFKAIHISLRVTHEVTDMYGKIMHFAADRHHIYLQPRRQKGGQRHIGYYWMTQEDIEQVIKDQPEIWAVTEENPKEDKENKAKKDQEKDKAKEKYKGKATLDEKQPSTTDTGSSPRKKERLAKPTYQAILHDDDFNTIADRVCDNMSEPITTITTAQEVLKKTIEAQLMELNSLVSHAPDVAIPTSVQSIVLDPQGQWHRFISITPISICQPGAQEGVQEGAAQLDLVVLPLETLRTIYTQIVEEFNDREQRLQAENVELKQGRDQAQRKY